MMGNDNAEPRPARAGEERVPNFTRFSSPASPGLALPRRWAVRLPTGSSLLRPKQYPHP